MGKLVIELEDGAPWKASRHQTGESKSSAYARMMRQAQRAIQERLSTPVPIVPKPPSVLERVQEAVQTVAKRGPGRPRKVVP
jgi:hypothetical protein